MTRLLKAIWYIVRTLLFTDPRRTSLVDMDTGEHRYIDGRNATAADAAEGE